MRRSTAFIGGVAFAGLIGVFLVLWWIPWLTQQRDVIVSTPSPPGLFASATVPVKGGQQLCWSNLVLQHESQVIGVFPVTGAAQGPPLRFELTAPGYSSTASVPTGYGDHQLLRVPLGHSPPGAVGKLCVRPQGGSLQFVGTTEPRTRSRPDITVGGKPYDADAVLYFYRRTPAGIISRLGDIAAHAQVVAAPFFGRWLLFALLVLFGAGIPIALGLAIVRALRES